MNRSVIRFALGLALGLVTWLAAGALHAQTVDHVKISDTFGGFSGVLADDDHFGWMPASVGDLDGDGVRDLAVGAPFDNDGAYQTGAVWILFLNSDGTVKGEQKISALHGGFTGVIEQRDEFGHSVIPIGDFDGDGVEDIAVGALRDDDGGTDRGALWLLFLNDDGTVKDHRKISQTEGGFGDTLADDDGFGHGVAWLGDVDGDGTDDLAAATGHVLHEGLIWVLFMNPDGSVRDYQRIGPGEGGFTGQLGPGAELGHDMDGIGDFDGDGVPDLAAGVPFDDDGGSSRGAVFLLLLRSDGTVKAQQKISDTAGNFHGVLDDGDVFGHPAVSAGDLDRDGTLDLLVGAPFDDDGGVDRGAFWILYLDPDGTVKRHRKVSSTEGGFTGPLSHRDIFAHGLVAVGDLDGDGLLEVAAGAPRDDDGGSDRGAVWILTLTPSVIPLWSWPGVLIGLAVLALVQAARWS